jgi:FtsH-binding integral membrane protein
MSREIQIFFAVITFFLGQGISLYAFAEKLDVPFAQEYIFNAGWLLSIAGIVWAIVAYRLKYGKKTR